MGDQQVHPYTRRYFDYGRRYDLGLHFGTATGAQVTGLAGVGVHGREAPAFAVSDDVSDRGRGEMCPKDQDVAIGVVADERLPRHQADLLVEVEVCADAGIGELYRIVDEVARDGGLLSL